jgi:pimeloyl-ACP methyl ester carboxylesterase
VVVTGSWTTVKEQMPANYAPILADAGFTVLTFDFRGFGESEGEPRDVESARGKAEDLRNAVACLRTHPAVDPDRIGALPICASAGYVALASLEEAHIRSIAMVAPWLHDAEILRGLYGGDDGVQQRADAALLARERYAASGDVEYVPAASGDDEHAAMHMPADQIDYYLNPRRGAIPEWGGRFAVMAWKEWLDFDPIALAPRVDVPVRLVTGEQTATPAGARKFHAGLRVAHDSVWLEGTQFDFYDQPDTVAAAAHHAIEHLRGTL